MPDAEELLPPALRGALKATSHPSVPTTTVRCLAGLADQENRRLHHASDRTLAGLTPNDREPGGYSVRRQPDEHPTNDRMLVPGGLGDEAVLLLWIATPSRRLRLAQGTVRQNRADMSALEAEGHCCRYDPAGGDETGPDARGNDVCQSFVGVRFGAAGIEHLFHAQLELSKSVLGQSLGRGRFDRWWHRHRGRQWERDIPRGNRLRRIIHVTHFRVKSSRRDERRKKMGNAPDPHTSSALANGSG